MAASAVCTLDEEETFGIILALTAFCDDSDDEAAEGRPRKRRATLPYVMKRHEFGAYHSLVQELAEQDPKYLHKFLRMDGVTFDELLHIVGPRITKQNTNFKVSIAPEERLAVTLHFLAQGGRFQGMFYLFRIPESTLGYLIPETCSAIAEALSDHLKIPSTEDEWRAIQDGFKRKWQFPQCLGAMDGKHIKIHCPNNAGSAYFNYKEWHSMVLFALVDSSYKFRYHEVGAEGSVGDATIWNESSLKRDLENGMLNTPPAKTTPRTNVRVPSLIVGDSAFALSPRLMKPYAERGIDPDKSVFNYRLSRARRVVENAFGILAWRFGIFQHEITQQPPSAKKFVLAALALHNFLRELRDSRYCGAAAVDHYDQNHQLVEGQWRNHPAAHLPGLQNVAGGAHQQYASGAEVRDALKEYFVRDNALPWQNARRQNAQNARR